MTLAVDIGNTSICLGVFECGERLVFRAKLASDHRKSADEYAVLISGVFRMHGADLSTIERAVMLSVVPALTHTVCEALGAFGIKPLIVGSGVKTGLCLRVDTPNLLGTDIVADTVAAMRIAGPPMHSHRPRNGDDCHRYKRKRRALRLRHIAGREARSGRPRGEVRSAPGGLAVRPAARCRAEYRGFGELGDSPRDRADARWVYLEDIARDGL